MEHLRHRLSLDIPSFEQIHHRDEGSTKPSSSTASSSTVDIMTPAMLLRRHAHLHLHHHHHHHHKEKDRNGRDKGSGPSTPTHRASLSKDRRDESKGIAKVLSAKVGRGSLDAGRDEVRATGQAQAELQPAEKEPEVPGVSTVGGNPWMAMQLKDKPMDEAGLIKLQQQRKLQEETVSDSLTSLGAYSSQAMSELDSRYYAILESLSKLQSTLSSLQQISSATRRLSQHFEAGARELDADVQRDIADFGGALEARQVKIEALGERVRRGRERVGQLDQRLGTVSDMVTVWERKEQEWRTGVRRRLRILWTVIAMLLILFIILYVRNNMLSSPTSKTPAAPGDGAFPLLDNFTNPLHEGYDHDRDARPYPGLSDDDLDVGKEKKRKEDWMEGIFQQLDALA